MTIKDKIKQMMPAPANMVAAYVTDAGKVKYYPIAGIVLVPNRDYVLFHEPRYFIINFDGVAVYPDEEDDFIGYVRAEDTLYADDACVKEAIARRDRRRLERQNAPKSRLQRMCEHHNNN